MSKSIKTIKFFLTDANHSFDHAENEKNGT